MTGASAWQGYRLHCKGLSVARGGAVLLQGLDLDLAPGPALVLRGANGIGKTSLLRTIAGLQPPRAGHIALPEDEVAYGAHADGLKSALTVAENLDFWAAVHGAGDPGAALAAMNLGALAHRRAAELSAGQKRRLGLARLAVTGRWL
jgi:heme exporter protein A